MLDVGWIQAMMESHLGANAMTPTLDVIWLYSGFRRTMAQKEKLAGNNSVELETLRSYHLEVNGGL